MVPQNSETIKILFENNPDTPISAAALGQLTDFTASYMGYEFADLPERAGTILTCDTVGDPTYSVLPNTRLIIQRGTVISITNEAEDTAHPGVKIIPVNTRYRVFCAGLEDIFLNRNDLDQNPSNPPVNKIWGSNLEYFVFWCDKDDAAGLPITQPGQYSGGGQVLISLKRIAGDGSIEMFPVAQVPGRSNSYYSTFDTRIIGGFKTDIDGKIISSSVWDIAGKFREVKATQYSIINEFAITDDDYNGATKLGRHLYRPLRPGDLDTSSTSHNNVFENTVTINGDLIIGGVDPRPGSNFGDIFNNISNRAELRFNTGILSETPRIFIGTTGLKFADRFPAVTDFLTLVPQGMTYEGDYQHRYGNVVFNNGDTAEKRIKSFTVKMPGDDHSFYIDPANTIGVGIPIPTARIDVADNGPQWVSTILNGADSWHKAIRLRDLSSLMFGSGDTTTNLDSGKKFYGISSLDNKLYFFDTPVSSYAQALAAHYYMTVSGRDIGVGTKSPTARMHILTESETLSQNGSVTSDILKLENNISDRGSVLVMKDATREWEMGSLSAPSGPDKEGFYLYNRTDYIDDVATLSHSSKRRNFLFFTPDGLIGSGTQDPDVDFQLEKIKNSDLWIKLLNTSTGTAARSGISFHNPNILTETEELNKFEIGLSGPSYVGLDTHVNTNPLDTAFLRTETGVSGGMKVEIKTGGLRIRTSDYAVGRADLVITDPSIDSKGAFVGINMNNYAAGDAIFQENTALPQYMLDVRSSEFGDSVTIAQFKADYRGSTSANVRISGSRSDLQWPWQISSTLFDNFNSELNSKYTLASIAAGSGIDSTVGKKGGLIFSTNDGSRDSPIARMYITSEGKVGIGQSGDLPESISRPVADPDYELDVKGNIGLGSGAGTGIVGAYLYHNDDEDTYLRFNDTDNEVQLVAGGVQALWLQKTSSTISTVSIGNTLGSLTKATNINIDLNSIMYLDSVSHKVYVGDEISGISNSGATSPKTPTAEFDLAYSTAVTQYIRTTGADKLAQLKINGARTAIASDISAVVFENVGVESARISTKLETVLTDNSNLIFSTNDGSEVKEAMRITSGQDLSIGFAPAELALAASAKISVKGNVHIGSTPNLTGFIDDSNTIPAGTGENNLEVDGSIYLNSTLYHQTSSNVYDYNTYMQFADDSITLVAGGTQMIKLAEGTDPDTVILGGGSTATTTDIDLNGVLFVDKSTSDILSASPVIISETAIPSGVGINNIAPLYNLDVTGTMRATRNMLVGTSAIFNADKSTLGNFTVKGSTVNNSSASWADGEKLLRVIPGTSTQRNQVGVNTDPVSGYALSVQVNNNNNGIPTTGSIYAYGNIKSSGYIGIGNDPNSLYSLYTSGIIKTDTHLIVCRDSTFNSDRGSYTFTVNGTSTSSSLISASGTQVGINTQTYTSGYTLTVSGNSNIEGNLYTTGNEITSGTLNVNSAAGTSNFVNAVTIGGTLGVTGAVTHSTTQNQRGDLIFDDTVGAHTRLVKFNSSASFGADTGYIWWQSNSAAISAGTEKARLTIGVGNDSTSISEDELWLQGSGRVVSNVGSVDSELSGMLGTSTPGTKSTGDNAYEWRVNNSSVATLNSSGALWTASSHSIVNGNTVLNQGSLNALKITTNNGYTEVGAKDATYSHFYTDRSAFYFGQPVFVDGNITRYNYPTSAAATLTGYNINGSYIQASVADKSNDLLVSQLLRWKNGGNGSVIFDASNSTSPSGSAINNSNSSIQWSATYPTLMGWNGSQTYGVKVDRARYAETVDTTLNANYAISAATCTNVAGTSQDFYRFTGSSTAGQGFAEIATAIDGNEPIYVRQYSGQFATVSRELVLLDANGNTTFPGTLTALGGMVSGNAATATNFNSPRTVTVTGLNSTTATSPAVNNGTYTVSISGLKVSNSVQADTSTSVSGGSMNLATGVHTIANSGDVVGTFAGIQGVVGGSDYWFIGGSQTANNSGFMEIATGDEGTEPIYVRQYSGVPHANATTSGAISRSLTLLDASGNTTIPGTLQIGSSGTLQYNQSSPAGTTVLGYNGNFYASKIFNAVYNDLAEFMFKSITSKATAGDVLVATEDGVKESYTRADPSVVGVFSDSYGIALYQIEEEKKHPVGMTGTVKVKVKGIVKIGDVLVSYKNGYAVKANLFEKLFKRDCLIGKVISSEKDSDDRVMILIK